MHFEFKEPKLLSEDQRLIRDQIRRFVEEVIVPQGDAWEAAGEIPRKVFRDLGQLGFLGMLHLPAACAGEKIGTVCVTEPHAGSDVAGIKSRALPTASGWVLNGSKTFVTNGVYGDIYIVAARSDPETRGSKGISLFIVDKGNPGLKVARKFEKYGWP
jgi:acyl-CoA dehydrogenase